VRRFEPTTDMELVKESIKELPVKIAEQQENGET